MHQLEAAVSTHQQEARQGAQRLAESVAQAQTVRDRNLQVCTHSMLGGSLMQWGKWIRYSLWVLFAAGEGYSESP
jgi:hypothetical protein